MKLSLPIVAGTLLLSACAAAGGPVSGSSPQTTTISTGGDARMGGGATTMVTTSRDVGGSTHRVEALIDDVWRVLPAVYEELGVAIGTANTAARTIGNTQLTLNRRFAGESVSRFLNCGAGPTGQPLADQYRVDASMVTVLHPEADGTTRVETRLTATATNRATSGAPVACGSTGRMEERIARMAALRVTL